MSIVIKPGNRRHIIIGRWLFALTGIILLSLDLARSHLQPGYAWLAELAVPLWIMATGIFLFIMPFDQELWSERTIRIFGLIMFMIGSLNLMSKLIFVD